MKKNKLDLLTDGLFNEPIKEEDLLREVALGKLSYKNKVLAPVEKNNVISQAQLIKQLELHKMLMDEIKNLCFKKIYFDSKDQFDIAVGKMGLWFIDIYEKKLQKLSTMKPDAVPVKK